VARKEVEVFMMVVRHYEIDFNSGRWGFRRQRRKGDKEDHRNARIVFGRRGARRDHASFRIAAIRETFEESGILLARPKDRRRWSTPSAPARSRPTHRAISATARSASFKC